MPRGGWRECQRWYGGHRLARICGSALPDGLHPQQRGCWDPSTLPENVDLTQTNLNVYPTKGAVVKANFATRVGYQVLMTLKLDNGVVPFGAVATLLNAGMAEVNSSIVGDDGQVYLTGLPERGSYWLRGETAARQCRVSFDISGLSTSPDKTGPSGDLYPSGREMMNMNPTQCNELSAEHDERTKWHNDDLRDAQRLDEAWAWVRESRKTAPANAISGICDSAGLTAGREVFL